MLHLLGRTGGVVRRFFIVEFVDRFGRRTVWHACQGARHDQVHEPGIFGLTEGAPLGVVRGLEDLRQIARLREFGVAVEAEHARAGGGDERRESAGGDVGDQPQRLDIVRMLRPFVVPDERAVGLTAWSAELVFIDFLEQQALVEFHRPGQIARQLPFGDVDDLDLQVGAGLAVHHQIVHAAPASLEFGELGVVHDRVKLRRQLLVDCRDRAIERAGNVFVEDQRAGHRLLDEILHQIGGLIRGGLLGRADHLIEEGKSAFRGRRRASGLGFGLRAGHGSALLLVDTKLAREGFQLVLVLQNLLQQIFEFFRTVDLAHEVA